MVSLISIIEPGGRIALELARNGSAGIFRVRDSGIGIGPDLLPNVFDLFAQANRSLHRAEGGLGIGLTLVRNLVAQHGGQITARSEGTGRGSTFVVNLPMLPPTYLARRT
jgi:signal transduction histidine kinase